MSRRVMDMAVGEQLMCTRHKGFVLLSHLMKKEQRRICDSCIAAYKAGYDKHKRKDINQSIEARLSRDEIDGESWKYIPGIDGYQASNMGRVRSIDRADTLGRIARGRVLSAHKNRRGYITVRIGVTRSVHHLVAMAFIGERPDGYEIAHRDGNPWNNKPCNLRWSTHEDNEADKAVHGTKFYARGELNGQAKLNSKQVLAIRGLLAGGTKQNEIATLFGVDQSAISNIKRRKNWLETEVSDGI